MNILFDIGASKMRVAASDGKVIQDIVIAETPQSFEAGVEILCALSSQVAFGKKIDSVCGGVAASLDPKKEKVFRAPNLPRWDGKNLAHTIRQKLKVKKVILENDTAVVGLGEAMYGAGKKKSIVAYITISTGINGVRIVDGHIDRNSMGFEIGHQIIGNNPKETFEYFAGARSLAHRYGVSRVEDIRKKHFWNDAEKKIAVGVHNTLLYWSPDVVVLGGGSVINNHVSLERILRHVKVTCKSLASIPPIRKAQLEDLGGLYGALVLINQKSL